MTRFLNSYPLIISTLGPVHIGCGEDYEPTGYVMEDQVLHVFDPVEALRDNTRAREELSRLCDRPGAEVIQKVQEFFFRRREELIPFSTHCVTANEHFQKFYDERVMPERNKGKNNQLQIERTAHVATEHRPILPGSSLKGAIRTALLNQEHGGKKLVNPRDAEKKKDWKKLAPLDQTLKHCLPQDFALDPMRLIRVSDANSTTEWSGNDLRFAVNMKISGGTGKGPYQMLECLPPMEVEIFSGEMSFLDPGSAGDGSGLPAKRWKFEEVVRQCNGFYEKRLRQELTALQAFVPESWSKIVHHSLERGGLRRMFDANRAFLLRVGRHCGAESVTLDGVRHIFQPQSKKWIDQPETVWLAARDKAQMTGLLPFGWLLVEWNDSRRRPLAETAPELARLSEGSSKNRKKRLADAEEKKKKLLEMRAEVRLQQEKEHQERERLALEKENKEKSLQSLSPNRRQIAQFQELMEKTRILEPISGNLWREVQVLVKKIEGERQEWLADEVAEFTGLCRDLLPGKIKGGDKKIKELIQRLTTLQGEGT
ncbi:MAG: type III-A CRISPR-associated RAMP protein Csm5 [Magnetococcales bacterium]|nr:type III-A CRISPR-associated RAMP protein Csm5 [Magnetococcales bacterium]MBF0149791.1 type III-A CRISPR-associated RAMP protein Csm5 [Magnetococcales bacterium]